MCVLACAADDECVVCSFHVQFERVSVPAIDADDTLCALGERIKHKRESAVFVRQVGTIACRVRH